MPRTVSIRRSLLVNLIVVITLLGGAIMATTFFGARRAVRTLSRIIIERTIDQTEARLEHFFAPVITNLLMARSWGEAGMLDTDDAAAMNRRLVPIMKYYPQITSLMVADDRGREHMVLRTGTDWLNRQCRPDEWGTRTRWLSWSDDAPQPVESWRELDYDPRTRPWFTGAIERRRSAGDVDADQLVHWTEPYIFFTTKDPGITASVTLNTPGSSAEKVIGFDVLLNDISTFTTTLQPSENGMAFVLTGDLLLIGLPRTGQFLSAEARAGAILKRPSDVDVPVATDAARAYWEHPPEGRTAFRFESEGTMWWGGVRTFPLADDRDLMIGVVVPEADLLGNLTQMRAWIILITVLVLAGAIGRAVVLAGRYSRPIEELVRESERMSRGDLEPGEPIQSTVAEVRRLADAHDHMRRGLQSLMKLERDLQLARQIQQSTFPNRLPNLKGFAIEAWSQPAEETGGDTYDVIGYQSAPAGTPIIFSAEHADRAVLLMADATGHGIGPALSVTQVRAMLRMAVRSGENLVRIARHMNEQLCADLPEGLFITAWLGELSVGSETLRSFSAGQAPLLHYRADAHTVDVLEADSLPLGINEDLEIAQVNEIALGPGDIFAVISDGIFEARDGTGQMFGTDRVVEVLRSRHRAAPDRILSGLREAVAAFTGDTPAADDRTAIIIKRTGR